MGCIASKEENRVDADKVEKEFVVKPIMGSPTTMYPYNLKDGKPKVLGSGAYSTVYEATDKVLTFPIIIQKFVMSELHGFFVFVENEFDCCCQKNHKRKLATS